MLGMNAADCWERGGGGRGGGHVQSCTNKARAANGEDAPSTSCQCFGPALATGGLHHHSLLFPPCTHTPARLPHYTHPPAPRRLTAAHARSVGNEKWVWTFDQFVDLSYVWVTASDTIPTGPTGGLLQVNMTRVIQDNSTVAGQTEQVNSLGYYCETLLNILQVPPWAASSLDLSSHVCTQGAGGGFKCMLNVHLFWVLKAKDGSGTAAVG